VLFALSADSVRLRNASPADAQAFSVLFEQFGYPGSAGSFEARLSRLASDRRVRILVAEDGDAVIGIGMLQAVEILEGDDPLGVLLTLIVEEGSRRRGVGTAIVEALEHFAQQQDCFGVVVQSGSRRIAGHALYSKLGYDQTGERFIKVFEREPGP
jgi:predicted N-acetyltransferase YhbS